MVEQTNTSNTFSAGQRPNLLRDPEISGSRSRGETIAGYFDTTAFQAPAESSAARHAWPASGPGSSDGDMSAYKQWSIGEAAFLVPLSGRLEF